MCRLAGDRLSFGVARYSPVNVDNVPAEEKDSGHDGSRERLGAWNPVGRGIEGRVNRLAAAGGCLYAAGDFSNVSDHKGTRPAVANLARYCPNGREGSASALWEPAVIVNGGARQSMAPLFALASSIPPGHGRWVPEYVWQCSGINITNATNMADADDGACVKVPR